MTRGAAARPVRSLVAVATALVLAFVLPVASGGDTSWSRTSAAQTPPEPIDCEGPVEEPESGSPEWHARDAQNVYCAEQRLVDAARHPVAALPVEMPVSDPYRDPSLHAGTRFRHHATTITNREGQELAAELYLPCDADGCSLRPEGLRGFTPPYPAVLVQHGGYRSRKELHRWATQSLAEAGYMTLAIDAVHDDDAFFEDATDALDWLMATPDEPTEAGEHNPFWQELDSDRIGVAGHSGGGATANRLGSEDARVSVVVAWDRSGRYDLPERLPVPSLYLIADHGFTPERRDEPPPPDGYEGDEHDPGDKWQDFAQARAQGTDTMKIVLRAATHLDWVPLVAAASRYGEAVSAYYTIAWFDRYLRGRHDPATAHDAFDRLTATSFDDSYDLHNISQGLYDPAAAVAGVDPYAGNVPYTLDGMPVEHRLSFYFRSKCFLTVPDTDDRVVSEDMRNEPCAAPAAAPGEIDEPPTGPAPGTGPDDGAGDALPATGGGAAGAVIAWLIGAAVVGRSGTRPGAPRRRYGSTARRRRSGRAGTTRGPDGGDEAGRGSPSSRSSARRSIRCVPARRR